MPPLVLMLVRICMISCIDYSGCSKNSLCEEPLLLVSQNEWILLANRCPQDTAAVAASPNDQIE
jgi:hypothetical protein